MPLEEWAVDLIGPWIVQIQGNSVSSLTCSWPSTLYLNLLELVTLDDKTSVHFALAFAEIWLAQCPWLE